MPQQRESQVSEPFSHRLSDKGKDRGYGAHVGLQAVKFFLGHDEIQDDGEYTGQEDGQEESSSRQVH